VPPRLKWLPLPIDRTKDSVAPPQGLEDFQVGWYWNLFWSALGNSADTGYLPCTRRNLWTFAGAHRRAHWDANCALVMAAFELSERSGQIVLYHPVAVRIVEEQLKKLKDKKRGGDLHTFHRHVGDLSPPLQSGFAFDLVEPLQIQKPSNTRARAPARASYSHDVGDAIDLRKMAQAWAKLAERDSMGRTAGYGMTHRQMFEHVCELAGVSIARGLELEERRKKWPEKVPDWLKEDTG
jgi:hypothetical protein